MLDLSIQSSLKGVNIMKSLIRFNLMLAKSIISFRKRFVILTPWFIRNQLVFDKRKKSF